MEQLEDSIHFYECYDNNIQNLYAYINLYDYQGVLRYLKLKFTHRIK